MTRLGDTCSISDVGVTAVEKIDTLLFQCNSSLSLYCMDRSLPRLCMHAYRYTSHTVALAWVAVLLFDKKISCGFLAEWLPHQ